MSSSQTGPLTIAQQHAFKQTAFVVRDLEKSVQAYWDHFRIGPWTGWDITPEIVRDAHYRGKPANFSFRHALAWKDGVQFELVQPVSGDSLFSEHLEQHGEGLHHIGMYVTEIEKARAEMEARGFRAVQGASGFGAEGDGQFCYFETDDPICTVVELVEPPAVRRPPTFTFEVPAQEANS